MAEKASDVRAVSGWLIGRQEDEAPRIVADAIDRYLASLRRQDRSPRTIEAYGDWLRQLERFLLLRGVIELKRMKRSDLEAWQDSLIARGLKPNSRAVAATAARSWLRWADDSEYVEPRMVRAVTAVKVRKGLPRPITPDELARLKAFLIAVDPPEVENGRLQQDRRIWRRDRALFSYLLTSGARIAECLSVRRSNFVRPVVRQKGGREKVLDVPSWAIELVEQYLALRDDDEPWLWVSFARGRKPRQLSDSGCLMIWSRLTARLGVQRFTNHQLRHSCATYLYAAGVPDLVLAQHLGHAGTGMLPNYAQVVAELQRGKMSILEGWGPVGETVEPESPWRPALVKGRPDRRVKRPG